MKKRLYRSDDGIVAGVCAGIAEYFNVDPVIVRVFWVFLIFLHGAGVIAYLVAWLIIPPQKKAKVRVSKSPRKRKKRRKR